MARTTIQDEAVAIIRKQFGAETVLAENSHTVMRYSDRVFTISKAGCVHCLKLNRSGTATEISRLGFISQQPPQPRTTKVRKARHPRAKRRPEYIGTISPTRLKHGSL